MNEEKERLKPLYDELFKFGYVTELLPKRIKFRTWTVDAINTFGEIETIYLHENASGSIFVQSTYNESLGILDNFEGFLSGGNDYNE